MSSHSWIKAAAKILKGQYYEVKRNTRQERLFTQANLRRMQLAVMRMHAQRVLIDERVKIVLTQKQAEAHLVRQLQRISSVIKKTHLACGAAAELADDEALLQISELVDRLDISFINPRRS